MQNCGRWPCGGTGAGCTDPSCPNYNNPMLTWPPIVQTGGYSIPQGCICPPTSEKTCENPTCPRQNHLKHSGAGNDLNRPQTT